jgi:hypothetical protein
VECFAPRETPTERYALLQVGAALVDVAKFEFEESQVLEGIGSALLVANIA